MLDKMEKALGPEDRERIAQEQIALEEHQAQEQDPDLLPRMTLADVSPNAPPPAPLLFRPARAGMVPVQYSPQPTSELAYVRGFAGLDSLPKELQSYLPIFASTFGAMGTSQYSYGELSHRIQNCTGGCVLL